MLNTRTPWAIAALAVSLCSAALAESPATQPDLSSLKPAPAYTDMADQTWKLVDKGTYAGRDSGKEPKVGLFAYSGMDIDLAGRRLVFFGGGHADSPDNDVWTWDINTQSWKQLYKPDPFSSMTREQALAGVDNKAKPGVWLPSGRPITRHTYGSLAFLQATGELLVGGGSTYSGPNSKKVDFWCDVGVPGGVWLNGPADVWLFDIKNEKWNYLGSGKQQPAKENFPVGVGTAVYASNLAQAIVIDAAANTWLYDPQADRWTNKKVKSIGGGHSTMAWDSKRQLAYLVGRSGRLKPLRVSVYDPAANTWKLAEIAGEGPIDRDGGAGIAYDSLNDVAVVFGRDGLWIYDPSAGRWIKNPGEPADAPPPTDWVFGRLRYDPVNNVCLYACTTRDWRVDVWAYRYKKAK